MKPTNGETSSSITRTMFLVSVGIILTFPSIAFSESIEKRLDQMEAVEAEGHSFGGSLSKPIESFSKAELMAAMKRKGMWMRSYALHNLKTKHLNELNKGDFKELAGTLNDENQRICREGADLLSSDMHHGKEFLVEALRSGRSLASVCAATGLMKDTHDATVRQEALALLLNCLASCSGEAANLALNHLTNNVYPEALPHLKAMLVGPGATPEARKNAATVWAWKVGKEERSYSRKLLFSDDPNVRRAGAQNLCDGGLDDASLQDLLKVRHDSDENVRAWVYHALRDSKNKVVIPALIEGISDSNGDAFSQSIFGIEEMGAKSALPALVKVLAEGERTHSKVSGKEIHAGNAVSKLTGQNFSFGSFGICGNVFDSASAMISKGNKIGGPEGKALIEEGNKANRKINEDIEAANERTAAKNTSERQRLLKWWKSEGKGIISNK